MKNYMEAVDLTMSTVNLIVVLLALKVVQDGQ